MIKGFIKSLIGDATTIIDDVVTTKEEKIALKNAMKKMLLESEVELQKNVTERGKADMASDSWLSKNVRPLTLAFLLVSTVILIFIDAGFIDFEGKNSWVDLLQLVMISVVGAYFGGRSLEKIKK